MSNQGLHPHHSGCFSLQVLDRLTPVEQQLLSQRLTQLRHVLDPGFSPLNWNSLGIPDFVATCNRVSVQSHLLTIAVVRNVWYF